jgi:kynurenine 3-monooxygenase
MEKLTVVGGGLVGSLLTVFLAKKGFAIDVFERRPDMRKEVIPAGRSINLALSDRGWLALERAGIADSIRKVSIPRS